MAHLHEKIDFTTSVYIVFDNKVLLHQHKKLGTWLPPGGHIELDEDPVQAAIREAKEESGLDVDLIGNPQPRMAIKDGSDLLPPKFLNRHLYSGTDQIGHEHVDLVYFARTTSADAKGEEGAPLRWFTREEIERNDVEIKDVIRTYALAALDELSE
jgi:8-oxo-dGTP pyrophosphatase MutT (NUDIX family)